MSVRPGNSTSDPTEPERVRRIDEVLAARWPDAVVELDHRDAFELLCATILAAQ